jgi:hypothetical protein
MIPDVLFDAVVTIRRNQEKFPDIYEGLRDEIEWVIGAMDRLRKRLDTPPTTVNVNHVIPPDLTGPGED